MAVCLFTDSQGMSTAAGFDQLREIKNPHRRSKVDCIGLSPFERTLYLDAEMQVLCDLSEVFDVLARFDVALCHAHGREAQQRKQLWREKIPSGFPQFNGGLMAFRRNAQTESFLKDWGNSYHEAGFKKDQVTLRELLWSSDLRIATLPPEYNIRYRKYLWLWGAQEAKPKILHFPARQNEPLAVRCSAACQDWWFRHIFRLPME
jgi:hypothetical protein